LLLSGVYNNVLAYFRSLQCSHCASLIHYVCYFCLSNAMHSIGQSIKSPECPCVRPTFLKLSSFHLPFPFAFSIFLPLSFNLLSPLFFPLPLSLALSSSPPLFLSFPLYLPLAPFLYLPFLFPFIFSFPFTLPFPLSLPIPFFPFPSSFHFPSPSLPFLLPLFHFHFAFPFPSSPLSLSFLSSVFLSVRPISEAPYLRNGAR